LWIIPGTALTCWIPWILNTHQLLAIGFGGLAHRDALALLLNLGLALERNLAWLIVLVLVGTGYVWKRERHDYVLVVCVLLAFSYAAFLLAAGVDIEYRFLTPILTPSIILTGIGLGELAGKLASGRLSRDLLAPIMAMVCVIGFVGTVGFRWHVPATNTIDPVVEFLRKRDTPGRASVLVPTSAEGPFIAQFAMRDLQHLDRLLVRPVKLLASETWNGGSYLAKYSSQAEMIALFDRFPLRYIILAAGGPGHEYEHDVLLRATLEDHPERWTRIAMPSLNWVLYERSDGRELPAGEMEALAREALSPRLHDFE
jgi:hypothetical protein